MASKVPGLVITVPPTAKLPCSWMISGSRMSFRLVVVHAETITLVAISKSADDLRCFVSIDLSLFSPSLLLVTRPLVLFVGHLLHPVDDLAVQLFLDGDMRHGCRRRGAMPMLFARWAPD